MKRIISNGLLVACSFLVSLLLGEAAIRIYCRLVNDYDFEMWRYAVEIKQPLEDVKLPFEQAPKRKGTFYGVEISTNSLGLRGDELTLTKPAGTQRIIFLGDSFTLGWGVPFESLFSTQLEKQLEQSREPYEVINMGVGNYNSIMEVEFFKRKGLALDPDIVILMYFANDMEPTPRVSRSRYALFKHFYLPGVVEERLNNLEYGFHHPDGDMLMEYYRRIYAVDSDSRAANGQAILELEKMCADRNISLLIVNIPELRQLKDYPFDFVTDWIQSLARQAGVPFLDLHPVLEPYTAKELWVSPEDRHMNELGNTLAARAIYSALRKEQLVK